jgi:serine/threonine protein kinase/tetratricopeptide (TPR) repeat protein
MTPDWQRVKAVFDRTVECDPASREKILLEECGTDEELLGEVRSLLAVYQASGSFPIKPPLDETADPMIGRTIGPYRVVHQIGRGGMGFVYLAERADDQFRRRVALKVVNPALVDKHTLHRFENERQTLAMLDHPNIIKLIDGGTTEDGLPWLVMDYVEGEAIDQYCETHKLSIAERLKLFRTVCAAVHYAHQNLVIHRDLKPGNILVTPEGVPKLFDFGIAKLLRPEFSRHNVYSGLGLRLMTPEFASPEQFRGLPITTASDIYSLGVLLYYLVAGRHPYTANSPEEWVRAICETEPQKPSTAAQAKRLEAPASTTLRRDAGIDRDLDMIVPMAMRKEPHGRYRKDPRKPSTRAPQGLGRSLRGDLDAIVLTAMRKEPQRRYASAEHLSEDIRRYLANEPVLTRGDSLWYRFSKFAGRHPIALPAMAVTAALLAWLVVSDHRDRLIAEQRLVQVRALARGFWDVDEAMRSGATPARKAVVSKALAYLDGLDTEARNDPALQLERVHGYLRVADLQGNPFRDNLGQRADAKSTAARALALAEDLHRRDGRNTEVRAALAQCHLSLGDIFSAEPDSALDHYRKALDFAAGDPIITATIWSKIAPIQADKDDPAAALESSRKCEEAARKWLAANPDEPKARDILAFARERFAKFALDAGETIPDPEEPFRQAVARYEAGGGSRRNLAMAYKALAEVQRAEGKTADALANCRRGLAISQTLLEADPRNLQRGRDVAQGMRLLIDLLVESSLPETRVETARAVQYLKPLANSSEPDLFFLVDYTAILVRSPFPEFREGEDIVAIARRAVDLSRDNETLDLLARAYEVAGDIAKAIDTERQALAALPPPPPAGRPVPVARRTTEASLASLQSRLTVTARTSK